LLVIVIIVLYLSSDGMLQHRRERTLFPTTLQKQTTVQMVNMWQAARKGLKPIELATEKEKKLN